jgi:hypothetical protein
MTVAAAPGAPESSKIAQRDWDVVPFDTVNVALAPDQVSMVASPAIASSTIDVMFWLTTSPHVPASSPVAGNASFKILVKVVDILKIL